MEGKRNSLLATFSPHEHKNISTRALQMQIVLKSFTTWTCLIIWYLHKTTVPRNVPGCQKHVQSYCNNNYTFCFLQNVSDLSRQFCFVKNVMTFKNLSASANRPLKQTTTATANVNVTKQKVLMSRTIALHLRFESWYISWPFSAKQQGA